MVVFWNPLISVGLIVTVGQYETGMFDGEDHGNKYDGALVASFGCCGGAVKRVVPVHDCKVGRRAITVVDDE